MTASNEGGVAWIKLLFYPLFVVIAGFLYAGRWVQRKRDPLQP